MPEPRDLQALREAIEEFDRAILARLRQRMGLAEEESAARVYGLAVLRRGIQSQECNYTRFVELSREAVGVPPEVAAKTSLLLITGHQPGALAEVLSVFGRRGVNLAKLESRPIPARPFEYRFYLDLDGSAQRDPVKSALAEAAPLAAELRVLGIYPAAEPERAAGAT